MPITGWLLAITGAVLWAFVLRDIARDIRGG